MKKPLIGLTPSHNVKNDDLMMRPTYMRAITNAGGIPLVLPLEAPMEDLTQLVDTLDGFLFTGGPDVHPFQFGEETLQKCGDISIPRDRNELTLLSLAMKARKPILGICRGAQLINIGLGGTIYQDIASQFKEEPPLAHVQPFHCSSPSHKVTIAAGTKLAQIEGQQEISVNSMHHQAIKDVSPKLLVSGYATSGLVEAVEMPDYPYLIGVQWHPEYLFPTMETAARLFSSFVEACLE